MGCLSGCQDVSDMLISSQATDSIVGQTYEGGFAGAPGTEAHGAYAFCALACLCMLGHPSEILPK